MPPIEIIIKAGEGEEEEEGGGDYFVPGDVYFICSDLM